MTNAPHRIDSVARCDIQTRQESDSDILVIKYKEQTVELRIHPIERLTEANVHAAINQYRALSIPSIIYAPHISKNMARRLHENRVQFIDLNGNIYIESQQIYLFIMGEQQSKAKSAPSSPFSVAGIKLIFTLLSNPGIESMPYRTLSEYSDISLGSIDTVFRNLIHNNFLLLTKGKKRKLINKNELLNRWCTSYAEKLQPKLILSQLTCEDKKWWQKLKLNYKLAVWGGEVAAAKLTDYLKPEKISLYAENTLPELQAKYALRKSDHGEIIIYKRFWNFQLQQNKELAPELLIYAELINSGDSRNVETARIIYERYISKVIK